MKLFILRHGPAEDFAADGGDSARALTLDGRARVAAVAKTFSHAFPNALWNVYSSPYVRALSTAEIVASQLGNIVDLQTRKELRPEGEWIDVLGEVVSAQTSDVFHLLVSHEPLVSDLVAYVSGKSVPRGLGTACVVGFELAAPTSSVSLRGAGRAVFAIDGRTGLSVPVSEFIQ